jgi:phosphoglycolate phosphatase-like HAD superfamily hydrolase
MRFQLGIFDWDGTLLDNIGITHEASSHTFKTLAPEVPIPTLEEFREEFSAENVMEYYYKRGIPRTVTKDELYALWESKYDPLCIEHVRLHKGAGHLLHILNAYHVRNGIVSAARPSTVTHLERLKITRYFEHVLFDAHDKEIGILAMLDRCKILPRYAFYVDDTVSGIQQAKRAGVTTIGFIHGQNSERLIRAAKPDHVVGSMMDILHFFRAHPS